MNSLQKSKKNVERLNFLKSQKNRFRENFDLRG